jgi:fructose 1,6-bisphosphate aldolase/phosphatase
MQTTLTAMRADVGSIGGHLQPSEQVVAAVAAFLAQHSGDQILDHAITYTGDDITLLCTHRNGPNHPGMHDLIWGAFGHAANLAVEQGLYGAGQDIFKEGFSGAAKGLGPALAEMVLEERGNEAFLLFSVDKSNPGAFNLPFYLAFADPMHCPGLMLSPRLKNGFSFEIMDVVYKDCDRVITLHAPEDLYNMAALLRDDQRFAIRNIYSRTTGEQAVAVSTTRLHHIAGILLGKDDPVAIVRVQDAFPAAGEILAPFGMGAYVSGSLRGSHHAPLMPVRQNGKVAHFDGPPSVSCTAYCLRNGKLTAATDAFDHPVWDHVRGRVAAKALEMRSQGFFGNAMLPFESLAYGGIMKTLQELDDRFIVERPSTS